MCRNIGVELLRKVRKFAELRLEESSLFVLIENQQIRNVVIQELGPEFLKSFHPLLLELPNSREQIVHLFDQELLAECTEALVALKVFFNQ